MLEVRMTLRVFSTAQSLADLKWVLGEPTTGFSIGDAKPKGKGTRDRTYWALKTSCTQSSSLESHALEILSFLDKRGDGLTRIRSDCDIDVFCMLSTSDGQGGALLPVDIMRRLVTHGLGVVFDVYSD
jgi:hypothetical protein